jgi:hypothetical protein
VTADSSSGLLRRLEIGALVWCAVAMAVVLAVAPARTDILLGVAGGGLLSLASFFAIRATVDAFLRTMARPAADAADAAGATAADAAPVASSPDSRPGPGPSPPVPGSVSIAVKLTGRYALLALLAYVMIARLRLHPLGLLLGMTALAASATAEAVRSLGRPGRLS